MKQTFKRTFDSLKSIFEFIDEFALIHGLDASAKFSVSFVIEELFTNMVKYNPDATNEIAIALEKEDNAVVMVIVDRSTMAFDLTKQKAVDVNEPLSQRRPGGLGIHLVKQIADRVEYQFDKGVNTITVTKHLKG